MAMIKCPKCNEDISDKAFKCVHCGKVLVDQEKIICRECGEVLEEDDEICRKCGCPVENKKESQETKEVQQVEVTKVNMNFHFSKKSIIFVIMVILTLIGIGFGVKKFNDSKVAAEEEKARQESEKISQEYKNNLRMITLKMLTGSADAETCGNLIKSVWYNTIYEKTDSETDNYTRANHGTGAFYDDFNDSLSNLFNDLDFSEKIGNIQTNQEEVNELMKKMKNPPKEWEDAYDDLKDYYDNYIYFTNLVINPSGSLQTFSSNFYDADTAALNSYDKMKQYIDL